VHRLLDDPREQVRDAAWGASHSSTHRAAGRYAEKFQRAIVHMSRGRSASFRTTDGSKPECILQSRQRGSWRDSQ
jgi:hypothetical protein